MLPTPDQIAQVGAIAVFLLVFAAAVRGDLRFRPGIDDVSKARDDALVDARAGRARAEAHADRLVTVVDKLGDALEARNRRDEQVRREDT